MILLNNRHFIAKHKIKNFVQEIQISMIEAMEKIPQNPYKNNGQDISHTDWNIPQNMYREYLELFKKKIWPDFQNDFFNLWGKEYTLEVQNIWFQLYEKNDYHDWHTHAHTNFTNILYVKLPSKNMATEVLVNKDEKISLPIEEGDIVTLPGYLPHRSPINMTNNKKYAISFNTSLIK